MDGIAETPAVKHLLKLREDGETVTCTQVELFRTHVEKILFVSFRSRPDLKTALDFCTMRVRNPDGDDHKKIYRTIHYIRETKGMEITLEA